MEEAEDEEEEEEPRREEREKGAGVRRTASLGGDFAFAFAFAIEDRSLGFDEDRRETGSSSPSAAAERGGARAAMPLFLARGLGIDRIGSGLLNPGGNDCGGSDGFIGGCGGGGGGDGGSCGVVTGGGGGEQSDMETHHKRMVDEDPSNALFLSNYAKFLYQVRRSFTSMFEVLIVVFVKLYILLVEYVVNVNY